MKRAVSVDSKAAELKRIYEDAVRRGAVHEGIDALVRLTELHPADPESLLFAASAFENHGDAESALSCAERAFRLGAVAARDKRSRLLVRLGRREAALASIRESLRQRLSAEEAVLLADLLIEIGAFKAGKLLLEKTLAMKDVRPAPILLRLARLSLWSGNAAEAESWAERACAAAPGNLEALGARGAARVLAGKAEKAVADLDAAAEGPDDLEARVWRAEARRLTGDLAGALSDVEEVLNIWGTALGPRVVHSLVRMDMPEHSTEAKKRTTGVIEDCLHLLPSGFKTPYWDDADGVRAAIETILRRLGGNRTSRPVALNSAGELALFERPISVRQHCRAAQQTINYQRPDRVLALFAALEERYPKESVVHTHRGEILLWLGDYQAAARSFLKAQELDPHGRWPYIGLYASAVLRGRYEEAADWERLQAFIKDFEVMGPGRTFFTYAGEALRRQGRREEAERHLDRALRLDPQRLGAWINMALVLLDSGRPARARECFEMIRERARPLFADAAAGLELEPREMTSPGPETIRALMERCLVMMRGNRSSLIQTYFDGGGSLKITPALPQWAWKDSWREKRPR